MGPREAPALWLPDIAVAVVSIETKSAQALFANLSIEGQLASCASGNEHHVVLGRGPSRLRLCILEVPEREEAAYILPLENLALVRLAAIHGVCRWVEGKGMLRSIVRPPKPYQRHRLIQLLQVYDAQCLGASVRDITYGLLFPRQTPVTGADWKNSSVRRVTLNLMNQSRRMVDDGYRRLLAKG